MKTCIFCSKEIDLSKDHYVSSGGNYADVECGDDLLSVHNFTQHDEFPYIDNHDGFDGGAYLGEQWKKVEL